MARFIRWRVVASTAIVVTLALSSLTAHAGGSSDRACQGERRSCAHTAFASGCCRPPSVPQAPLSIFAETWSHLTRLHVESTSWLDDVAGVPPTVFGVSTSRVPDNLSRLSVPAADPPSVLLI